MNPPNDRPWNDYPELSAPLKTAINRLADVTQELFEYAQTFPYDPEQPVNAIVNTMLDTMDMIVERRWDEMLQKCRLKPAVPLVLFPDLEHN